MRSRLVAALLFAAPMLAMAAPARQADAGRLDNAACLECHDGREKIELPATEDAEEARSLRAVPPERYARGAHANMEA